jgi:AraC family transcriptional regulator
LTPNLPAIQTSHVSVEGMLASNAGVPSTHATPALSLDVRRLDAPSLIAMVVRYDRNFTVAGDWYSDDVHYFDMSLTSRPSSSRGCFTDLFGDFEKLGKVFFAPAGYRLRAEGGEGRQQSLYVFLRAHALFLDEERLGGDLDPVLRACLSVRHDAVRDTLARIGREVCEPSFASELMVEGLGLTMLADSARLIRDLRINSAPKGGLPPWRLKLIEERVRSGEQLPSLAELAGLCGLSRRQLMRAFREETGQTIGAFIQTMTVEHAKTLLSETDAPVGVIAGRLGFATAAAFSAAFRRATGQPPRSFRRLARSPASARLIAGPPALAGAPRRGV